jgi:pseudouridine kinase
MKKVVIIGGAVIDFFAYPHQKMILHDSNPGYIKKSLGGVGRNIAENLARLDIDTTLITVIGNDEMGKTILDACKKIHIRMVHKSVETTPIYLSVMDEFNEDLIGVAAMDQILELDEAFLASVQYATDAADILVVDTNLSENAMKYIFTELDQDIYVDAISSQKAIKIRPFLHKIHGLKLNLLEAELLTGIIYETMEDLNKMGDYLIERGVREVFITLGKEGAYYTNIREAVFRNAIPVQVKNGIGAGDAFFAGALYAKARQKDPLAYAMVNAYLNLQADAAVSDQLSVELIEKTKKELHL